MAVRKLRTCKSCGHDNPENAFRCNNCASRFGGFFNSGYITRWACPECNTINMLENSKCLCGYKEPSYFWVILIIIIIISLVVFNIKFLEDVLMLLIRLIFN